MNVMIFKLVTGDEVIGSATHVGMNWEVCKPRVVQMVPTEHGMSAGLIPFMLMAPDDTIRLNETFVVASVEASMAIRNTYQKQTSSLDLSAVM